MNTIWLESKREGVVPAIEDAIEHLESSEGEVVLDFSGVERIDAGGVVALEKLASSADGKHVGVVLRGVNVAVYKVLKLTKIEARFAFAN